MSYVRLASVPKRLRKCAGFGIGTFIPFLGDGKPVLAQIIAFLEDHCLMVT
jgi:hypothetical protein